MKKTTLENIFGNLENDFDTEIPKAGHETRFMKKLNDQNAPAIKILNPKSNLWKPIVGIAASVALLISLLVLMPQNNEDLDLASVSPKMAETETLFMASFSNELKNLNSEDMPEYQELIVDALFQIKVLEEDFKQLIIGLKENPDDELVLSAMILNFQKRIDVLQDTKDKIKELKEHNNTINII